MKTAVIFHPDDEMPQFIVLNGDYTRFNGIWLNDPNRGYKAELAEELSELVYGRGIYPVSLSQFEDEIRDGAKLITCGTKM
jgi:hypothetical protein